MVLFLCSRPERPCRFSELIHLGRLDSDDRERVSRQGEGECASAVDLRASKCASLGRDDVEVVDSVGSLQVGASGRVELPLCRSRSSELDAAGSDAHRLGSRVVVDEADDVVTRRVLADVVVDIAALRLGRGCDGVEVVGGTVEREALLAIVRDRARDDRGIKVDEVRRPLVDHSRSTTWSVCCAVHNIAVALPVK